MIFYDYFSLFYLILTHFSLLYFYGKSFWSFVYFNIHCVVAGVGTLLSISDWSDPYIFHQKMEKMQSVKEEMDGGVFVSRQSQHPSFVIFMIEELFSTLYLDLACKKVCFRPRKRFKKTKLNYQKKEIFNITSIICWLYWLRLVV